MSDDLTVHATEGGHLLLWLGGLLVAIGGLPLLGVLGIPPFGWLAGGWSALAGVLAWPIALSLIAAGGYLLWQRPMQPWHLPWGRVVAFEVLCLAALALLAYAGDAGGLIGWSLAQASRRLFGDVVAVLSWSAAGVLASLAIFRLGTRNIVQWFEDAAEQLSTEKASTWAAEPDDGAMEPREIAAESGVVTSAVERVRAGIDAAPASTPSRPAARRPPPVRVVADSRSSARRVARASALPEIDLLEEREGAGLDEEGLRALGERIVQILDGFGVPTELVEIEHGPAVTRFGLVPGIYETGGEIRRVKISRIVALRNDLALALSAPSVRIEAPVPGRSMVGVEIPNPETRAVGLAALLRDKVFRERARGSGLALALGRDVSGAPVVADLGAMPHLLVGGATGSGKSVCLSTILASLLFQSTPDALRLILIDPKRVELTRFGRLPHLLAPVVTDVHEVVGALRWVTAEMERRYRDFAARGARDLSAYNRKLSSAESPLPKLVVIVDELADLMMQAPAEVEPLLTRIAQMARATGIHLVLATQRPSTDVITGMIKANIPARIAFAVSSGIDSRVILDSQGAETLLGRGDMLFQDPDSPRPRRLQGAMVTDQELERLASFWVDSPWPAPPRHPPWDDLMPPENPEEAAYEEAVAVVLEVEKVSASYLQRRLRIGYSKASKLLERMRRDGFVDEHGVVDRGPDPALDSTAPDDDVAAPL